MKATVFPFTRNVIVAIVFLYTIGFLGSLGVAVIRYTDYADLTDLHGFFY